MKCAKIGCGKEVTSPKQKYCSADCAPYAHLGVGAHRDTESTKRLERYGSEERGDSSPRSSAVAPVKALGLEIGDARERELKFFRRDVKNEPTTGKTETKSIAERPLEDYQQPEPKSEPPAKHGWNEEELKQRLIAERGGSGMQGTESATSLKSDDAEMPVIRRATPSVQYDNTSEATSDSLNLIDDSSKHMFGLMKSVAIEDHERLRDPRVIHAAANCAKQIHSLIRLKFDILKELRTK